MMQQQQQHLDYPNSSNMQQHQQQWYPGSELDFPNPPPPPPPAYGTAAPSTRPYINGSYPAEFYPPPHPHPHHQMPYGDFQQQQYSIVAPSSSGPPPPSSSTSPPPQSQQQQQPPPWQQQPHGGYNNGLNKQQAPQVKIESGGLEDALTIMESHANSTTTTTPIISSSSSASPPKLEDPYQASGLVGLPTEQIGVPEVGQMGAGAKPRGGSGRGRKAASSSAISPVSSTGSGASRGRGKNRSKAAAASEDNIDPELRAQKEKDRRFSNNTRERMRIRDINDALAELGRICQSLNPKKEDPNSKPVTKLGVLNMAVDVITNLEQKVKERNLNPSALCLPRGPGGGLVAVLSPPARCSRTGRRDRAYCR